MFDLFLSEFKRYRTIALLICFLQGVIWAVSNKFIPFMMPHPFKMMGITFLAVIGGGVFGLASIALHKRKNHWTYLIHRPLAPGKIYLAMVSAGLALLFISVCLPFLASVTFLDLFSNNVVEARHYLMALHIFLMAGCAYFIGVYAVLSPIKSALLAIVLMQYIAHAVKAPVGFDILIDFIFFGFTFYLARSVFQINLNLLNLGKPIIFASVLALQPAMLLLLVSAPSVYYHMPLKLIGMHPHSETLAAGDFANIKNYFQYRQAEPKQKAQFLLTKSGHEDAKSLSRQSTLSEFKLLRYSHTEPHFSQQLFLKERKERFALMDNDNDAYWVFSHALGVFVGLNTKFDKKVGYFGREGFFEELSSINVAQKFQEIPLIVDMRFVQTSRSIYGIDFKNKKVTLKYKLPEGEYYTKNVSFIFDRAIVMSNVATYFFDVMDFNNQTKALVAEHIVPNPMSKTRYDSVFLTEVLNGFLIQYRDYHFTSYESPGAALVYAQHNGRIDTIASHTFEEKVQPDFIAYQPFILSPFVLNLIDGTLNKAIKITHAAPKSNFYFWQRPLPTNVIAYAFILMLVSAVMSAVLLRSVAISKPCKYTWVVVNFVLSVPGLLALVLHLKWQYIASVFNHKKASDADNKQPLPVSHSQEQSHV